MKYPTAIALVLLLAACRDSSPSPAPGATNTDTNGMQAEAPPALTDSSAQPANFFPVQDFLESEVAYVDSLPVGIKLYHGDIQPKKYKYIKAPEFHRLAAEFLPPAVSDSFFRKHYSESSFFDQSTNTGTFFYKADHDSLPLQRVDVISKRGEPYDKVTSIYMQKFFQSGDTDVVKRMMWTPQKSFQIITEKTPRGGELLTDVVNVVWATGDEQ